LSDCASTTTHPTCPEPGEITFCAVNVIVGRRTPCLTNGGQREGTNPCRAVPLVHLGRDPVQTSFTVHASDSRPGAELVDVVLSSLLGQGFALLTSFDGPGLAARPCSRIGRPNH
jgi:hypothetical protein